jgi:hypothetical protein
VLIPDGNATEIIHGWERSDLLNSPPWELPGEPRGIGQEGLEALRKFIEEGGGYIGIGAGGGLLATEGYAGLINLSLACHSLGTARVMLRIGNPAHPLVYGLSGHYDENGEWKEGVFPAFYHSEALSGAIGGPIFKAGEKAQVIAYYHAADHDPTSHQIVHADLLGESAQGVAVAFQEVNKGMVTVIGVRPGFRAVWTNTYRLLSNAIFYRTSSGPARISLA